MGHEGFAVVLADVTLGVEPGLAPEIAGELAAVSVLNNDDILLPKDPADLSGVEGNDPFYLKVVGHDAFFAGEFLDGFANHALGRAPADNVTAAFSGPKSFDGAISLIAACILRPRFSTIIRRLCGFVNSSLIIVPSSSCSSVAAVKM